MAYPLRHTDFEPDGTLSPLERTVREEEDFFSMVADRQDDFELPYFPDPEGYHYGNV